MIHTMAVALESPSRRPTAAEFSVMPSNEESTSLNRWLERQGRHFVQVTHFTPL